MALGWLVFVLGKPLLDGKGEPPDPVALAKPVVGPLNTEWLDLFRVRSQALL